MSYILASALTAARDGGETKTVGRVTGTATGGDTYRVLKVFSHQNGVKTAPDTAKLMTEAKNLAFVIDNPASYYDLQQMRAWAQESDATNGGDFQLLLYYNGAHMFDCPTGYAQNILAKSPKGNNLWHTPFNNSWLVDLMVPAARDWKVADGLSKLAHWGYDGIFIDELGSFSISPSANRGIPAGVCDQNQVDASDTNPVPADASGTPYTYDQWSAAAAQMLQAFRDGGAGTLVFNTGPNNSADNLWAGLGAVGQHDGWLFNNNDPIVYPTVSAWKNSVREIADAAATGGRFVASVKVFQSKEGADVKDKAHRFALASFLLGTDGNAFFEFESGGGIDTMWSDYYERLLIGRPLDAGYTTAAGGNLFYRRFTQGTVVVNPSANPQTLPAGVVPNGAYLDVTGAQLAVLGTVLTVPAYDSLILIAANQVGWAGTSSAVDNGDGTFTASGAGVADNGDGTFTLPDALAADNGDGTFTIA